MINNIPESSKWIDITQISFTEIKTQDRTLSKNNNPGLAFYQKNLGPLCLWHFFFKLIHCNMKYWHPYLPFGQHISVSTLVWLVIIKKSLDEQMNKHFNKESLDCNKSLSFQECSLLPFICLKSFASHAWLFPCFVFLLLKVCHCAIPLEN
jgi:hypothetical protein